MRALLVVVCLTILFAACTSQSCVSTSFSSRDYTPKPFNFHSMDTCCWYADNTCCYNPISGVLESTVLKEIAGAQELLAQTVSDQCYVSFSNFFCYPCDSQTATFIDRTFQPPTFFICSDVCLNIYQSCTLQELEKVVGSHQSNFPINSPTAFCQRFLEQQGYNPVIVSSNSARTCFSGVVNNLALITSQEGVCTPGQNSGFVVTAGFLSAFLCACLALLL